MNLFRKLVSKYLYFRHEQREKTVLNSATCCVDAGGRSLSALRLSASDDWFVQSAPCLRPVVAALRLL